MKFNSSKISGHLQLTPNRGIPLNKESHFLLILSLKTRLKMYRKKQTNNRTCQEVKKKKSVFKYTYKKVAWENLVEEKIVFIGTQ